MILVREADLIHHAERTVLPRSLSASHRRAWVIAGAATVLLLGGMIAGVALLSRRAEPFLRERIVAGLQDHFHARVELDGFHLAAGNSLHGEWGVWAEGKGLRIWAPEQRPDTSPSDADKRPATKPSAGIPPRSAGTSAGQHPANPEVQASPAVSQPMGPLIQLGEFRFHVPLRFEPGKPLRIAVLQLVGLKIDLPPRSHAPKSTGEASAKDKTAQPGPIVEVDRIDCAQVELTVETDKPGKLPQVYEISHAIFTGFPTAQPMHFDADLTIPRPRGAVHSSGSFGPWVVADPGESSVEGDYRLAHGDLSVFKGIAGSLDSTGHYQGTLREMSVIGQTSTPDFRLTHFGNALPLKTSFHARVDGTNGDTRLDSVDALIGRSRFTTQGTILRMAPDATHPGGHNISLAVQVDRAPIEDFLRLASNSPRPLLSGSVVAKVALRIPPGPLPVHERITLVGHFALDDARFSSPGIQSKIEQLSLRSQGHPDAVKSTPPLAVSSQMQADFHLEAGILALPALEYSVPGTTIQLQGRYGIEGGTLDFRGTAKMDATVSQMVGGWKGLLLKPADRFFRREGAGTAIPIHISGTREEPVFGVEVAGKELDLSRRGGRSQ